MVLFKLNPHVIIFFSFVVFLLLKQSVSDNDINVPSRLLKDSKLSMSQKIQLSDNGVAQKEEQDETGSSDSSFDTEKTTMNDEEAVKDEKREKEKGKDEGREEVNEEKKDEDDIVKDENKKKKIKSNENDEEEEKEDDDGNGKKGKKKKADKDDENEANEELNENSKKKKRGEKDDEKEADVEPDEIGKKKKKKKKKDKDDTDEEEPDENVEKKKKKKKVKDEVSDEEKAKEKVSTSSSTMSSSSNSFNTLESIISLTDSLKNNPTISPAIIQGCKKADFPPECQATLLCATKNTKKFDASSIFESSVKALTKALNVTKTSSQDPNIGVNAKDARDCEEMYKDSISALKGAMKAYKENDKYLTSLKLSAVVTNVDTCDNDIGQDSTSDLARANKVLSKLAANAISLGDAAMHFNSDQ